MDLVDLINSVLDFFNTVLQQFINTHLSAYFCNYSGSISSRLKPEAAIIHTARTERAHLAFLNGSLRKVLLGDFKSGTPTIDSKR